LVSDMGSDPEGFLINKCRVRMPVEFWKKPDAKTRGRRLTKRAHPALNTDPQLDSADRAVVVARKTPVVAVTDE
jgi:hypothetical protein